MKSWFTGTARKVSVDGDARYPREHVAGEDEWPGVSLVTGHPRIDKDVLQLSRAEPTQRAHPQARPAEAQVQIQARSQVRRLRDVTP
jgi:hypothetical protein